MRLMLKTVIAFVATTVLLALPTTVEAVIWGKVDSTNRYSYVGAIVGMEHPVTGRPFVFCSGSLVHSRVLLTAGHCTFQLESLLNQGLITLDDVRVSFSPNALDPKSWLEVQEVVTHPDYSGELVPTSDPVDAGALVLKRPVRKIAPAILPQPWLLDMLKALGELREGPEGGHRFIVAGYGATLEFPPPTLVAPDGLRRFALSEYLALTDAWLVVSRNGANGDGGSASGDSGGPVLWTDPSTGQDVLIGITSWGDPAKVAMTFKYRVDIPQTLDFVDVIVTLVESGWY